MRKTLARLRGGESGFSLVEVMVAMMLLVLAAIPMLGMMLAGAAITLDSKRADDARALAQEKADVVKAKDYGTSAYDYDPAENTFEARSGCQARNGAVYQWSIVGVPISRTGKETTKGATGLDGKPKHEGWRFDVRVRGGALSDESPEAKTWAEAADNVCATEMTPPKGGHDVEVAVVRMPMTVTRLDGISEDF